MLAAGYFDCLCVWRFAPALFIHTTHHSLSNTLRLGASRSCLTGHQSLKSVTPAYLSHHTRSDPTRSPLIHTLWSIWMSAYNASLHTLEWVQPVLIELHYSVLGNLVNIRVHKLGQIWQSHRFICSDIFKGSVSLSHMEGMLGTSCFFSFFFKRWLSVLPIVLCLQK